MNNVKDVPLGDLRGYAPDGDLLRVATGGRLSNSTKRKTSTVSGEGVSG
jgi:hypothetical protein